MLNRGLSVWHLLEFASNRENTRRYKCALMAARLRRWNGNDDVWMMSVSLALCNQMVTVGALAERRTFVLEMPWRAFHIYLVQTAESTLPPSKSNYVVFWEYIIARFIDSYRYNTGPGLAARARSTRQLNEAQRVGWTYTCSIVAPPNWMS